MTDAGSVSDDAVGQALGALRVATSMIGGVARPGQQSMCEAIVHAMGSGTHTLIQAGTGTGKSLGYLIPALLHDRQVVLSTSTLALQNQLAEKDIPIATDAVKQITGKEKISAVLKGRANYACLWKVNESIHDDPQAELVSSGSEAISELGLEVGKLRDWVQECVDSDTIADRDLAPPHTPRAWDQVSVSSNRCLGAKKCPFGDTCFAERAREEAQRADLVITNHALVAIQAMHDTALLPDADVLILDEAHDIVSRFTSAATESITPKSLIRSVQRAGAWITSDLVKVIVEDCQTLNKTLKEMEPGERITAADLTLIADLSVLDEHLREAFTEVNKATSGSSVDNPDLVNFRADLLEVREAVARALRVSDHDVIWVEEHHSLGHTIYLAPLSVAGLFRNSILKDQLTVMTSATLTLGGSFTNAAMAVGLELSEKLSSPAKTATSERSWAAIDVGSPFDYPAQGILYVSSRLPAPGQSGLSENALEEMGDLIEAAGGRALGLFASQRNLKQAVEWARENLGGLEILAQGEGNLPDLARRFRQEPSSCLFGTLSLWQGVDVPGQSCSLVIIDKIPFPRPNDPVVAARAEAAEKKPGKRRGSGFLEVYVPHAALLLAQGAGRLIRTASDRGVVAILDPRLITKGYGSKLINSMPRFWRTDDKAKVVAALTRLNESCS